MPVQNRPRSHCDWLLRGFCHCALINTRWRYDYITCLKWELVHWRRHDNDTLTTGEHDTMATRKHIATFCEITRTFKILYQFMQARVMKQTLNLWSSLGRKPFSITGKIVVIQAKRTIQRHPVKWMPIWRSWQNCPVHCFSWSKGARRTPLLLPSLIFSSPTKRQLRPLRLKTCSMLIALCRVSYVSHRHRITIASQAVFCRSCLAKYRTQRTAG